MHWWEELTDDEQGDRPKNCDNLMLNTSLGQALIRSF